MTTFHPRTVSAGAAQQHPGFGAPSLPPELFITADTLNALGTNDGVERLVSATANKLITDARDHEDTVNFWEGVYQNDGVQTLFNVGTILWRELGWETRDAKTPDDPLDAVAAEVLVDYRGSRRPDATPRPIDLVDFAAGTVDMITGTLAAPGEPRDPAKLLTTLRLLVEYGKYKMDRWGDRGGLAQLRRAVDLIGYCVYNIPGFNPNHAGMGEALGAVIGTRSALRADQLTKRADTSPGRGNLYAGTGELIGQIMDIGRAYVGQAAGAAATANTVSGEQK